MVDTAITLRNTDSSGMMIGAACRRVYGTPHMVGTPASLTRIMIRHIKHKIRRLGLSTEILFILHQSLGFHLLETIICYTLSRYSAHLDMAYSAPVTIAGHIMHMAWKNLAVENCDTHWSHFQRIWYARDVHHLLCDLLSTPKLHHDAATHKIHTTVSCKYYNCTVNYDNESHGCEKV